MELEHFTSCSLDMLLVNVRRTLDIWFKYSLSVFENENFVSSGLNEIEGNRNSDFGVQARVKF